ncbi:CPBP family intramembrane glutamic endopeptidase [Dokdonia sinensis]|uniref:CPBP family intramembrane glutamic endopeptidase n=1 Tax=Dokdonia sinensis TaxID=2479847 RepID=UPI001374F2B9|nr:CPBP family intramembrane glutamic endopeptidase [Dokdonia sinensis]
MQDNTKLKRLFSFYFKLWGLYILFAIAFGILATYYPEFKNEDYEQTFLKKLLDESPLQLFVLAVIFAPIIEEMMFRTLIRPSHNDLMLFITAWPIFYVNRFIPVDVHWVVKIVFIAVFLFTVYYLLIQGIPERKTLRLRNFLERQAWAVLVITSLIFGLVHINNYVDEFAVDLALFMLIVPRILSGWMMGLLKLRNKHLIWSIALHALNNGVVVLIMIWAR